MEKEAAAIEKLLKTSEVKLMGLKFSRTGLLAAAVCHCGFRLMPWLPAAVWLTLLSAAAAAFVASTKRSPFATLTKSSRVCTEEARRRALETREM